MKHSIPFGTFEILEINMCYLTQSESTFRCYNGSWVTGVYWEVDEVVYYRIGTTSCQVDYYPSEYIQLNWWSEGDMMTSSLRDSIRLKLNKERKNFGNFWSEPRIAIENFWSSLADMTKNSGKSKTEPHRIIVMAGEKCIDHRVLIKRNHEVCYYIVDIGLMKSLLLEYWKK